MLYRSTRSELTVSGPEAILQGIAPDGGLFVPASIPTLPWSDYLACDYRELASVMLSLFLPEFKEELPDMIHQAYRYFPKEVAPVRSFQDTALLELFHGPTLAFKDYALQLLPLLMRASADRLERREIITILTATSGDTGKAAMNAFSGVERTEVIVFYPDGGVSPIQELQMLTETADNLVAFALEGNFDDAQRGVKTLFRDQDFCETMARRGRHLGSANSINIGRLLPQMVYYVHAYLELVRTARIQPGESMDVSVPTGNFGNILSAIYCQAMGLPIERIICASNQNHILSDFLATGRYDTRRDLLRSSSPSMDILVSSNLERYLDWLAPKRVRDVMEELSRTGVFTWPDPMPLFADWADETSVSDTIRMVAETHDMVLDPHTAIAWAVGERLRSSNYLLVVATASPYKFPQKVLSSLGQSGAQAEDLARISHTPVPQAIEDLSRMDQKKRQVVTQSMMAQAIRRWMDD